MAKIDQALVNGTTYEIVPEIAPLFSESTAYAIGDCVIKDAVLYRFTVAHAAGPWIGTDAEEITIGKELTGLKADFEQLTTNENPNYNNIIVWDSILNRKLMWDAGIYRDNDGYWSTSYMPVTPDTQYAIYNPVNNTTPDVQRTHFFDQNKTSLGRGDWNNGKITTPANAAYMVLSKRYIHSGSLGTYNDTPDWDDYIGKMVVNQADNGVFHLPYPDYLNADIRVKNRVSISGKVISLDNAIADDSSAVIINRSLYAQGANIIITVCGRNIFDGILQDGYWDGNTVVSNSTHKASVNPVYVNGGDTLYFNKNCRVTEFDKNGTYRHSYIATARQSYVVSVDTDYIHVSSETTNMQQLCIYIGSIPTTDENYRSVTTEHTVRDWGTTYYSIPISLYDGCNTVFVSMLNSPKISVGYNVNVNNAINDIDYNKNVIGSLNAYIGTKLAMNDMFVAHRGATVEAPENTMPAIVSAFLNGYKSIEIDVRFTSDNVPVLLHDSTINRTSNGSGAVADLTYEQLQSYDFGSWFSSKYAGTKIPTFRNALSLIKKINAVPHIDIAGSTMTAEQINILCDLVFLYGLEEKAVWLLNPSATMRPTFEQYYNNHNKKFMSLIQVSTFPESSVITLLNNINDNYRKSSAVLDMGISINLSALTQNILDTALSFDQAIPIGTYFLDNYNDIESIHSYPLKYVTTNRLDLPMAFAHYYACMFEI